jgi:hypothetical protein
VAAIANLGLHHALVPGDFAPGRRMWSSPSFTERIEHLGHGFTIAWLGEKARQFPGDEVANDLYGWIGSSELVMKKGTEQNALTGLELAPSFRHASSEGAFLFLELALLFLKPSEAFFDRAAGHLISFSCVVGRMPMVVEADTGVKQGRAYTLPGQCRCGPFRGHTPGRTATPVAPLMPKSDRASPVPREETLALVSLDPSSGCVSRLMQGAR